MADSPQRMPGWVSRHVAVCPSCRQFQAGQRRLISALSAEARAQSPELPPFLHGRIIASVRKEAKESRRPFALIYWVRAALIPALGVFALASYLTWKPHPPQTRASHRTTHMVAVDLGNSTESVAKVDPTRLLAWAEKLDQPLESELHLVVGDAKDAFKSLAANFLPR